ncbi:hypothetical protein F4808DRAFT_475455 [Astrocystis sublimbata]|nr:hypothetical protein F4808DRAFT_475455 [Astrocystis sublimbata]
MEETPTIWSLAEQCNDLFCKNLSFGFSEHKVLKDLLWDMQHQYWVFDTWVEESGVFDEQFPSLDMRLRESPDIKALIIEVLEALKENLMEWALKSKRAKLYLSRLSDIRFANKKCVDRLECIWHDIRQISMTDPYPKGAPVSQTKAHRSFENLSCDAIRSLYPDAAESLQALLGRSMSLRYSRLRLKSELSEGGDANVGDLVDSSTSREGRHNDSSKDHIVGNHLCNPSTAEYGRDPEQEIVLDLQEVPLPETASSNVQAMTYWPSTASSPPSRKAMFTLPPEDDCLQDNHLECPKEDIEKDVEECQCSFKSDEKEEYEESLWWMYYIDDVETPYICISEKCDHLKYQFPTDAGWLCHMNKFHSESWARVIHNSAKVWFCDTYHEARLFKSRQLLEEHMKRSHMDRFTAPQLEALAEQSTMPSPRPLGECPLCCSRDVAREARHVYNKHLIRTGQPALGSIDMKRVEVDAATPDGTALYVPDPREERLAQVYMADHIAWHLRTIAILSRRLNALRSYTHAELDGNEGGQNSQTTLGPSYDKEMSCSLKMYFKGGEDTIPGIFTDPASVSDGMAQLSAEPGLPLRKKMRFD